MQTLQPEERPVRDATIEEYMWPSGHFHFFFELLPATTDVESHPKASAAILGWVVARSLVPTRITLFEQTGQLVHATLPVLILG